MIGARSPHPARRIPRKQPSQGWMSNCKLTERSRPSGEAGQLQVRGEPVSEAGRSAGEWARPGQRVSAILRVAV